LRNVMLLDLQRPVTWEKLVGFALVEPDNQDVLPFRTEYQNLDDNDNELDCSITSV
jgi:hypothetical protein